MRSAFHVCTALITASSLTWASPGLATEVFRCEHGGSTRYQQLPCTDGAAAVAVGDERTAQQRREALGVQQRQARTAAELAQARRDTERHPSGSATTIGRRTAMEGEAPVRKDKNRAKARGKQTKRSVLDGNATAPRLPHERAKP